MIQLTVAQAAAILASECDSAQSFCGLSIDTRSLQPGNLFIAIKGARLDGHQFLQEAALKGAAGCIVSDDIATTLPTIRVPDTTKALGQLAAYWRAQFTLPLVAVTGSNGKTTLKNMIASIMTSAAGDNADKVLATQGTLNNHWGLPLTLARLNAAHQYAVIEMGMNHFGEIDYLTRLTQPAVAVITNAAAAHLEGVGSIEGVAKAKAEIFSGLPPTGTAVLNRDDAFFPFWREIIGHRSFFTFGLHPDADVRGQFQADAGTTRALLVQTPQGKFSLKLPLLGQHNALHALAATAVALAIGIETQHIQHGIENLQPAPGRLQLHRLANGLHIIDDSYNANPVSLQAAVHTLAGFPGKKILILGDMKELGSDAKTLHEAAGETMRQAGIDYVFTYGELSVNTSQSFGRGGHHFNDQTTLIDALKPYLTETATVLVKGSRSMKMERIVAALCTLS